MKKIKLLLTVFVLFCSSALARDIPVPLHYDPVLWSAGGSYPMIVPDVEIPGRLYLLSDVAGCWVSNDYGETYEWLNKNLDSIYNLALRQSKKNPAYIYMLGKTFLVRSTNRGRTWETMRKFNVVSPRGYKLLEIDPLNEKTVYVATSNGTIQRSVNDGSFSTYATPFETNISPTFLHIEKTGRYLFVGSANNGLKRYDLTDDSVTTITLTGTNSLRAIDFDYYDDLSGNEHICVAAGLAVACSGDNGENFTYTEPITDDALFFISLVAVKQLANGEVRMMAHGRRISTQYGANIDVHSDDSGETWVSHYTNVTMDYSVRGEFINFGVLANLESYVFDPFNETNAYATTDLAVFKSTDGAANWVQKDTGAMNVVISDIKVDPLGGWWVCGMDIGLTYSANKGVLWKSPIAKFPIDGEFGFGISGHYWRIELPGFGGSTKAEWDANKKAAWDAGHGVILVTASMYINDPVYVPTVWRSEDNGETWATANTGLPTTALTGVAAPHRAMWGIGYPRALACHPNGSACYLGVDGYSATEYGGIFISRDKGKTWSRTEQPPYWTLYNGLAVDPTDVTGNTAVFGNSFILGGVASHFWKTKDGYHWIDAGLADFGIYDITYNSLGNIYATGLNVGPQTYYSTNGDPGTWHLMHTLNNTANIADGLYSDPNDPNILLAGVNDGTNVAQGVKFGVGGSIYMTTDALNFGEATWNEITGDMPNTAGVAAIAFDPDCGEEGCFLAGTDGAGVFKIEAHDRISTTLENVSIE